MVAAARAAAALAFAGAVAAAGSPQTEGKWGPALAGRPQGRSSRPPSGPNGQCLRGGQAALLVWARAPAAAGDSGREKLGSDWTRAGPQRNRPPAPRLSGGSTPVSVEPVPELGGGGFAPLRATAHPDFHVLSWGGRALRAPAPGSFSLAPLSPFGVGNSKGWRGWSVLGPTVSAFATFQSRDRGRGRYELSVGPVCLLPKFGRTAGSRRKPRRPGELALCHLVQLRRGSRFPVTAPEEAVPLIADLTRPCRAEGHGGVPLNLSSCGLLVA